MRDFIHEIEKKGHLIQMENKQVMHVILVGCHVMLWLRYVVMTCELCMSVIKISARTTAYVFINVYLFTS